MFTSTPSRRDPRPATQRFTSYETRQIRISLFSLDSCSRRLISVGTSSQKICWFASWLGKTLEVNAELRNTFRENLYSMAFNLKCLSECNRLYTAQSSPQILLGRSNQGEWGGRDMWHAWERTEMCTRFWCESRKERDHLKDQGVDGIRMDLMEIGWGSVEWIQLAQDRDRWRAVVNAVMNLRVLAQRS
jgi:hypothetical protein